MGKKKFEPDFSVYGKIEYFEDLNLLDNQKNRERLIKNIETIIRPSIEYRNYIKYLKTDAELNYCSLMNILPEDIAKTVGIEMHHFPFTLYDLVEIILIKNIITGVEWTRLSIANEVMELHFINHVGLVPLTTTAHQMMHNGHYFISKEEVFGDYEKFFERYKPYMLDEHIDKVLRLRGTDLISAAKRKEAILQVKEELYIEFDDSNYDYIELPAPIEEETNEEVKNPLLENSKVTEEGLGEISTEGMDGELLDDEPDEVILKKPKKVTKRIPSITKRAGLSSEDEE